MKKANGKSKAQVLKLRKAKLASAVAHAKAPSKGTIAHTITRELKRGRTCEQALAAVKKGHKGCKTTLACVYWYSSKLGGLLSQAA